MKLSLNWLQRYIDYGLTADELKHKLTMAGLEVESIENAADDVVFEIEVTPNRPDCLNMLGLAREVSAVTDKALALPLVNDYEDHGQVDIAIEAPEVCGRYIGTLIDGVQVQAMPAEYALLLRSIGLKPIANIVDITNFVMFEMGQPLHAFDFDKLAGGKIIVRWAKKGEKIVTLDDVERKLDESILVIADEKKPVAIAGIMGGRDTAVSSTTKRILLEAASFDMGAVRRASRKLGLSSDSCYRFERGVSWRNVESGSSRAADMILELARGAVVARKDLVARTPDLSRREITVTAADIESLLGAKLELGRAEKILRRLGCIVAVGSKGATVVPPHFRNDLKSGEDVIEEIARVIGYDNLPMTLPHVKAENIVVDGSKERFYQNIANAMIAQGYHEVVTYALMSSAALGKMGYSGPIIKLQNPMSAEQEVMRPTALPNLLQIVMANMNRGQRDLKLFEVGKKYLPGGERWVLSVIITGRKDQDWRRAKKDPVDFYDLKGAVVEALSKVRVRGISFKAAGSVGFEEGVSAEVVINGRPAGQIGRVADDVLSKFDIKKSAVYFAEIELETAQAAAAPQEKFAELNEFPAAVRDVSLSVKNVAFDAMQALCEQNGQGLLRKIDFVELYAGDKIESGHKGYVLSLTYQASDRTLTDDEVNGLHEKIIAKLIETFGVKRR